MIPLVIKILQYINIGITTIFVLIFTIRLCHLRHFADSQRYSKRYPKLRIIFAIFYILLSLSFLTYNIVTQEFDYIYDYVIEGGGGECIDSLILILQLCVLRKQLLKERPYTATHLVYSIYLTFISVTRFSYVLYKFVKGQDSIGVDLGFYICFMIDSFLLLGYWIAKRQELPQFEDHKYFNFEEFRNDSNMFAMNRHIEISYMKKVSQSFNYIRPTVEIQKNKFRIILEVFNENLKEENQLQLDSRKTKLKSSKLLQTISNKIYTVSQIKDLYKICGRFNLKQKITFQEDNVYEMYQNLQAYLDEIFSEKFYYLENVLKFFQLPPQIIYDYSHKWANTIVESQYDMKARYDKNASIISIKIQKQLWIEDHYIFYIDAFVLDGKQQYRPMKRYTDFESLHEKLNYLIRKKYNNEYFLPSLPKKYLFHWDESKINHRRFELQKYLKQLTNDYDLMMNLPEVRQAVLQFLNINSLQMLQPMKNHELFYKNIEVVKGSINKTLINSDYVTFYEFKLIQNNKQLRVLKKRFTDFVFLHEALERWMKNTKIVYKMISLPEKHLYKSQNHRQEKLKNYLANLIKIKDIYQVYAVNTFFNAGSDNFLEDLSSSGIEVSQRMSKKVESNLFKLQIEKDENSPTFKDKSFQQSSFSSNQRMSQLIEELGN